MGFQWEKKRTKVTCDTEPSNTGKWVTTSRKEGVRGFRKHLGAILPYLFSKQQRANLSSGTRGPGWAGRCQECFLAPEEIHSCIHSLISKSLSSGIWSHCEPVTICLNDLKMAWVGTESILSVPKQLKPWWSWVKCSIFTHVLCETFQMWPCPPLCKSNCIPLVWGNVLQCLIIPTK